MKGMSKTLNVMWELNVCEKCKNMNQRNIKNVKNDSIGVESGFIGCQNGRKIINWVSIMPSCSKNGEQVNQSSVNNVKLEINECWKCQKLFNRVSKKSQSSVESETVACHLKISNLNQMTAKNEHFKRRIYQNRTNLEL